MDPVLTKVISGRIAYRDHQDQVVGREQFELLLHERGGTLRALCQMDDIGLLREVSMALDSAWRPLDAFCRLTRGGRTVSSSWFCCRGPQVDVENWIDGTGRLSQRFPNDRPCSYLGLHPLQGDALITAQVDSSRPGEYRTVKGLTNSISENGDQGLHAVPVDIDVAFLGQEVLAVSAGQFTARKLALRWHRDWPPAYIWVRDEDFLFLKMTWSQVSTWYELVELTETPAT